MRLMITGATGFIGSRLVIKLLEEGHEIGIITRNSSNLMALRVIKSVRTFITETYTGIFQAIFEFKPVIVIHLATYYLNEHTSEDIPKLIQSNLVFGTQVLEAMSLCGIKKFLNFGTRWQHLHHERDNPANLYAATKNAFQEILAYYQHHHGITYTTLELCDTYGKGDPRKKIVELMVQACKQKSILKLSPGEQVLDLVCVDDLVDYIVENLEGVEFYLNNTYLISGNEIRLRDLGDIIEKLFNASGFLNWGELPYRRNEIMVPPKFGQLKKIARKTLELNLRNQYLET